jgi:hypothetical protein
MRLTRDSVLWTVVIIISVLGYLKLQPVPTQWDYYQWIEALLFASSTTAGILRNSWLKGKRDIEEEDYVDVGRWE